MTDFASDEEFYKRLLSTFKREAAEHIKGIIEGLLQIERGGEGLDYGPIVDRLFRYAHSLKGSSRAVNLLQIEEVCQELEGVFHEIKKGKLRFSEIIVDSLMKACTMVEAMIDDPNRSYPHREVVKGLQELKETGSPLVGPSKVIAIGICPADTQTTDSHLPDSDAKTTHSPIGHSKTLRIEADRLEVLLNQMEALIPVKGSIRNNLSVVEELARRTSLLIREMKRLMGSGYYVQASNQIEGLDGLMQSPFKGLLDLYNLLQAHRKRCIRDLHVINHRTEEILFALKNVVLMPLSTLLEVFPRMVRDIAKAQGKAVELSIEGGEIEVDRRILEELKDPLVHIIRNAIDHGIEPKDERERAGKGPTAIIHIKAAVEKGNEIVLSIADDGRGIDIPKLKEKLSKKGLNIKEDLSGDEVLEYIFRPEVSTAEIVTTLSGRGLGLSIAREKVEELGGQISVNTEPAKGTVFHIRLPINVSTSRIILLKGLDSGIYGIPTRNITATLRVRPSEVGRIEGKETISFGGRAVSVMPINDVLDRPQAGDDTARWSTLIVVNAEDKVVAFAVKEILHEEEVFVKGLGPQLKRVRNIAGAATISSGETIPILNPTDLIRSAIKKGVGTSYRTQEILGTKKKRSILIAEDSITARTLFKGILEGAGYEVVTAVDGLEAWGMLQSRDFDLLVSDVQMPKLDGFELTRKIRADKGLFRLPVVLITGLETREDKERGLEVGANAYIVKSSFDQSNLLEVVKRLI
jgi:two-component system chemotaxis sensor kinase CheA